MSMQFQTSVESEPPPTLAISIFSHNFLVGIVSALTGGIGGLLANFITFAVIAGLLEARVSLVGAVFILLILFGTFEPLELGGFLCFAIVGFTSLDRVVWKRKTKLRRVRFLMLGTALLFVAAVIEWSLEVLIIRYR